MIFVVPSGFSQKSSPKLVEVSVTEPSRKALSTFGFFTQKHVPDTKAKEVIAPGLYVSRLGFFCKQEIKMEKFTRVPFRFRLGNIEHCDFMEGKRPR